MVQTASHSWQLKVESSGPRTWTTVIKFVVFDSDQLALTLPGDWLCLAWRRDGGKHRDYGLSHPVSVVEADIYVNRFRTTMRLKCFAEDLELLQGVEALEDGLYDSEELLDATKDHAEYLAEKITIRNAAGELMTPKIKEIIDIEIPDEGIKAGNLMNFSDGIRARVQVRVAARVHHDSAGNGCRRAHCFRRN